MRTLSTPSLSDAVFERLLGERIVFLGSAVDDDVANRSPRNCCCSRPRIRSRTSPSTSTRPVAR